MTYNWPSSCKLGFKRNIIQQSNTNLITREESIFKPCQDDKKIGMSQVKN